MTTAPDALRTLRERPSVLVVDDVQANLVALEALLEGLDCQVICCRSGNEALRQLLRREFAVVLLDAQMPEMDGYEVAYHARQNPATRDVPIIFLTAAHNEEQHVLRGYGSGAVDFLFKPVTPDILRGKVRIFLELYAGRRMLADSNQKLEAKNAELRSVVEARTALAESFRQTNVKLEKAYKELQAAQGQLVQSAKMASLGQLVAGVAHEINNPLAFVVNHLATVSRSLGQFRREVPEVPASANEHWLRAESRLQEIELGLERIRDLVVKLRTFSRLDEGEWKLVSIRESVESLLRILEHKTKDRIQVEVRYGEPDMLVCFPGLLNQALMNLLSNAIDAIEGDGKVVIEAGAQGEQYVISVSDSGSGIAADIRERVIEPFFTTKPIGKGTGLGLSITYSIVHKHDGTLEFDDAPGGGTIATIRLPLRSS